MPDDLNFAPLPYSFIAVTGDDACRFLQGQTSCDVEDLSEHASRFGTVNTPKGRMVALFRIQHWPEGYLLRLHSSLVEGVMQYLGKYKVFFKCSLTHLSSMQAFGLFADQLPDLAALQADHWQTYDCGRIHRLPGASGLLEYQSEQSPAAVMPERSTDWLRQAARDGLPELFDSSREAFILQHLNLQDWNAVSFSKGCYTGQEIIARMKYLGKLKKKMWVLEGDFDWPQHTLPAPGSTLYAEDGSKAGQLVQIQGDSQSGWIAQAVCDASLAETAQPLYLTAQQSGMLTLIKS